jgi:hypothetical protein
MVTPGTDLGLLEHNDAKVFRICVNRVAVADNAGHQLTIGSTADSVISGSAREAAAVQRAWQRPLANLAVRVAGSHAQSICLL